MITVTSRMLAHVVYSRYKQTACTNIVHGSEIKQYVALILSYPDRHTFFQGITCFTIQHS